MRLIDADEFKRQIAGMAIINNYPVEKANKICELIDIQPTAYDVDKAMGTLKKYKLQQSQNEMLSDNGKWIVQKVIEECMKIVKAEVKDE